MFLIFCRTDVTPCYDYCMMYGYEFEIICSSSIVYTIALRVKPVPRNICTHNKALGSNYTLPFSEENSDLHIYHIM